MVEHGNLDELNERLPKSAFKIFFAKCCRKVGTPVPTFLLRYATTIPKRRHQGAVRTRPSASRVREEDDAAKDRRPVRCLLRTALPSEERLPVADDPARLSEVEDSPFLLSDLERRGRESRQPARAGPKKNRWHGPCRPRQGPLHELSHR